MIEIAHLVAVGVKPDAATTWLPAVQAACDRFEINNPNRIAAFLAQCAHESGGFTRLIENLNYSAEALMRVWPTRFPTMEVAMRYHRQPERIANNVYGSRMGNGPESSGEGWKYRGRGLKQLTGKSNYTACSKGLGKDLVADPDLLLTPEFAALSAGWFWKANNCSPMADAREFELLTKRINGGLIGLADRKARYAKALACFPS
jgi:putative chitinase